jgi:hypothetical protein
VSRVGGSQVSKNVDVSRVVSHVTKNVDESRVESYVSKMLVCQWLVVM